MKELFPIVFKSLESSSTTIFKGKNSSTTIFKKKGRTVNFFPDLIFFPNFLNQNNLVNQ